jgi:hypothetical protein
MPFESSHTLMCWSLECLGISHCWKDTLVLARLTYSTFIAAYLSSQLFATYPRSSARMKQNTFTRNVESHKLCVRFEDTTSKASTKSPKQATSLAVVYSMDIASRVSGSSDDEFERMGTADMMRMLDLEERKSTQRQVDQHVQRSDRTSQETSS